MFVGREKELEQVLATLTRRQPRVIAVRGPTGRGKSDFLKQIIAQLRAGKDRARYWPVGLQNVDLICGLYEIKGEFEDWAFPFLEVLRQIVAAVGEASKTGPRPAWFAKAVGKALQDNLGKIAGAIVEDVVKKGLPKTAAKVSEVLAECLQKISIDRTLEELLGEHRQSVMAAYSVLLDKLEENAPEGCRFILMFDNVQMAGEMFVSALKYLARSERSRFYVVYAFNDESEQGREFERRQWAELKAIGQAEIEVPRMTAPDVRRWIEAAKGSSVLVSHELLERVCEATDGRPFYIGLWMNSDDFTRCRIERPENLDGYFKADFGAISPGARTLAQLTAMLPAPLPDGDGDYGPILGHSPAEVDGWSAELARHRVFGESREKPWFRHSLIQSYIQRYELPSQVKLSLAEQAVRALAGKAKRRPQEYMPILAVLLAAAGEQERCFEANLQWAEQLSLQGEPYAALASLGRASNAMEGSDDPERKIVILLRQAEIHEGWGDWDQVETILREAEARAIPQSRAQGAVWHAQGILRYDRGDYDAALELYQKSLAISERLGDLPGMSTSYHQMGMVKHLRGD
jgi:hypothetical protein